MPYFDIQIKYVNERQSSYESPDFVVLEEIESEIAAASNTTFLDWFLENYGSSEGVQWEDMYQASIEYNSYKCVDGYFEARIKAHKSRNDLNYKMIASRGNWDESPRVTTEKVTDVISIKDAESYSFNNIYVTGIVCAVWEGDVLSSDGSLLNTNPEIKVVYEDPDDVNNNRIKLKFDQKCTGAISLVYNIQYDLWVLQIPQREENAEASSGSYVINITKSNDGLDDGVVISSLGADGNSCSSYYDTEDIKSAYSSTVTAVWAGGQDSLPVTVPDELQDSCDPDSELEVPEDEIKTYIVYIGDVFDYCSGDIISNPTIYIDNTLVTEESIELQSGTHTVLVTASGYTDTDEDDLTENDSFTLP